MKSIRYLTQSEVGRRAGVTRFAVSKAIERGQIETVSTADGDQVLIPLKAAEKWLAARAERAGDK